MLGSEVQPHYKQQQETLEMDPDAFLFKWDPRGVLQLPNRLLEAGAPPPPAPPSLPPYAVRPRELGGLEELFQAFGVRFYTAVKIAELGFTVSTLLAMKEEELDDMMNSISQIFRGDLLVGERYGIKAAVRAERRRIEEEETRRRQFLSPNANNALDALSQEWLSEEPVQQENEAAGSGGVGNGFAGSTWEVGGVGKKKQRRKKEVRGKVACPEEEEMTVGGEEEDNGGGVERQREHPFIVTEPGEVARGKKNGLDYLFHLYEQCREFLIQVQNMAKERGEKCPTKVTNQVFRYAKATGASYIKKPKMRHYVHCYALHCLDQDASNALRRTFKERGENVGAWRQACYKPLVAFAAPQAWDIDAIFNAHPRLAIWYVPTRLRQLCHAERSNSSTSAPAVPDQHLPF